MPPAVGQDVTGRPTAHGIGARLDCDDDTVFEVDLVMAAACHPGYHCCLALPTVPL